MDTIQEFKNQAQKTIDHLREELQTVRTGRPSAALLEGLQIDAYGGSMKMRLMDIATITNEGPTMLVVTPFDPSTTQDIEKGILKSPLNLTPKVEGSRIRVVFPSLTQEQREKYVKLIGQMVEDHRVTIRGHRDEARKKIKTAHDAKEITEDVKFRMEKDIDTANQKLMDDIQTMKEKKETQVMEV